jgi:hypothetical protein
MTITSRPNAVRAGNTILMLFPEDHTTNRVLILKKLTHRQVSSKCNLWRLQPKTAGPQPSYRKNSCGTQTQNQFWKQRLEIVWNGNTLLTATSHIRSTGTIESPFAVRDSILKWQ